GRRHYFGQLIGGQLRIDSGRLRLALSLTQRRPGPVGPPQFDATPPPATGTTTTELQLAARAHADLRLQPAPGTSSIRWDDLPTAVAETAWVDVDPHLTANDLLLTAKD